MSERYSRSMSRLEYGKDHVSSPAYRFSPTCCHKVDLESWDTYVEGKVYKTRVMKK